MHRWGHCMMTVQLTHTTTHDTHQHATYDTMTHPRIICACTVYKTHNMYAHHISIQNKLMHGTHTYTHNPSLACALVYRPCHAPPQTITPTHVHAHHTHTNCCNTTCTSTTMAIKHNNHTHTISTWIHTLRIIHINTHPGTHYVIQHCITYTPTWQWVFDYMNTAPHIYVKLHALYVHIHQPFNMYSAATNMHTCTHNILGVSHTCTHALAHAWCEIHMWCSHNTHYHHTHHMDAPWHTHMTHTHVHAYKPITSTNTCHICIHL